MPTTTPTNDLTRCSCGNATDSHAYGPGGRDRRMTGNYSEPRSPICEACAGDREAAGKLVRVSAFGWEFVAI